MKIELIESISLKEYNERLLDEMPKEGYGGYSRRDFLKYVTVGATGLLVPTAFYPTSADANPLLIPIVIVVLEIAAAWAVNETLAGDVVVGNRTTKEEEASITLTLVKSEKIVLAEERPIEVPPRYKNTYRFKTTKGAPSAGKHHFIAAVKRSSKHKNIKIRHA